jgi:hypothetical protein
MPAWLEAILHGNVDMQLPLKDILKDSLYYPASGLNGTPVKFLAGNIFSFVYADYDVTREQFLHNLNGSEPECGFKGYRVVFQRDLVRNDIVPPNWRPAMLLQSEQQRRSLLERERECEPFGHWSVWQRNANAEGTCDAPAFSFIFFAGEMSAIYQGLYCRLCIAPKILALIQPGAMGGEWESVTSDDSFFKKVVASNKAGWPEYLLHGGFGRGFYDAACWDEYQGERLVQLPERYAGLWKLND